MVILGGEGMSGIALPAFALLAIGAAFGLVALRRMRFDERKSGWA